MEAPCKTCICFISCKLRYQKHNLIYRCEKLTNYTYSKIKNDTNSYWKVVQEIFGKPYRPDSLYIM
ncbi:MAG: hypothetical protein ACFFG0_04020 [Candidatus Thorarchaeota archaeon]